MFRARLCVLPINSSDVCIYLQRTTQNLFLMNSHANPVQQQPHKMADVLAVCRGSLWQSGWEDDSFHHSGTFKYTRAGFELVLTSDGIRRNVRQVHIANGLLRLEHTGEGKWVLDNAVLASGKIKNVPGLMLSHDARLYFQSDSDQTGVLVFGDDDLPGWAVYLGKARIERISVIPRWIQDHAPRFGQQLCLISPDLRMAIVRSGETHVTTIYRDDNVMFVLQESSPRKLCVVGENYVVFFHNHNPDDVIGGPHIGTHTSVASFSPEGKLIQYLNITEPTTVQHPEAHEVHQVSNTDMLVYDGPENDDVRYRMVTVDAAGRISVNPDVVKLSKRGDWQNRHVITVFPR